jgi:hypothetical protein
MEGRGEANMPYRSLLPRSQGVGKKNQSGYFIAAPRILLLDYTLRKRAVLSVKGKAVPCNGQWRPIALNP